MIATRNRYELAASCPHRLAGQTVGHRAIVMDSGSTGDTPWRPRADWPGVCLVAGSAAAEQLAHSAAPTALRRRIM